MTVAGHLDVLRSRARSLPEAPGVYFWKDGRDRTLYIGKAVNLRARVTSYFSTARHDRRTRELLERACGLDFEVAPTELEALLTESRLIKQIRPPFNRQLLSPRKVFYLKLDAANPDPYLEIVREAEGDGSLYFGPFLTSRMVRETLQFVHHVLPLRKCTALKPRCRPCIYHQMGTCAAPLLDFEHRRAHREAIAQLHELLDGRTDRVLSWLEQKRDRLSNLLLFERAAETQQTIEDLRSLVQRQGILEAALHCRCVLVRTHQPEDRLLLVARGQVVSVRAAGELNEERVVAWIHAHLGVVRALRAGRGELDAASVLQGWIIRRRQDLRWVAIPDDVESADLLDRVRYVMGEVSSALPASAAVLAGA